MDYPILSKILNEAQYRALLGKLKEYDTCTYKHSVQAAKIMENAVIYFDFGMLSDYESIIKGTLLHDIGKIEIPKVILNKPDALSAEEQKIMERHPLYSLRYVQQENPVVKDICLLHHEHPNGKGYPFGIVGSQIPKYCKLAGVVDVSEALCACRPYKAPIIHFEKFEKELTRMIVNGTLDYFYAMRFLELVHDKKILKELKRENEK